MTSYSHTTHGDSTGPVALGPHARAVQHQAASSDLAAPLAELRHLLTAADLPARQAALRDLDEIEAEVVRPQVDELRVHDALERVKKRAGQLAGITAAAGQVWAAVQSLTG